MIWKAGSNLEHFQLPEAWVRNWENAVDYFKVVWKEEAAVGHEQVIVPDVDSR